MTRMRPFTLKHLGLAATLSMSGLAGAQPADPFASPGDPFASPGDPFAAAPDPFASAGDPFDTLPGADPFAPAAPAAPFTADPFGEAPAAPAAPAQPVDPFAGAPAATAAPSPFGGEATASPFGEATTTTADPFGSGLAAAALPSDQVNPNGIRQLYDFRYEEIRTWDGRDVVVRRRLTRDEATSYDSARIEEFREQAISGNMRGYDGGDPQAWAEWSYFAEQLKFWSRYVDRTVLAGSDTTDPAWDGVQWPASPQQTPPGQQQGQFGGPPGQQQFNVYNENRSLDNQLGDFSPFAGGPAGSAGQGGSFDPETITSQVVQVYETKMNLLREMEDTQEDFLNGLEARITERRARRIAYHDWREDRQRLIEDFVEDWSRRYTGEVAMIGGVRYELYRPGQVPTQVHRDATVIITDYELTPYDILNPEDGTLRTQTRR